MPPEESRTARAGLMESHTIAVAIDRGPEVVYAFASDPANFPVWVTSFIERAEEREGKWFLVTAHGEQQILFVEKNDLGVMDHRMILADGTVVQAPMRVIANGSGSTVLFTLFRLPGMSEADFERDANMVRRDLESLKRILEKRN